MTIKTKGRIIMDMNKVGATILISIALVFGIINVTGLDDTIKSTFQQETQTTLCQQTKEQLGPLSNCTNK